MNYDDIARFSPACRNPTNLLLWTTISSLFFFIHFSIIWLVTSRAAYDLSSHEETLQKRNLVRFYSQTNLFLENGTLEHKNEAHWIQTLTSLMRWIRKYGGALRWTCIVWRGENATIGHESIYRDELGYYIYESDLMDHTYIVMNTN
jgi:hypothetical protein